MGEIETAYIAACDKYASHRGHYTTLCMFWCALDFARYLMNAGRVAECPRVIGRMVDAYQYVGDYTGEASKAANQLLTKYYNTL